MRLATLGAEAPSPPSFTIALGAAYASGEVATVDRAVDRTAEFQQNGEHLRKRPAARKRHHCSPRANVTVGSSERGGRQEQRQAQRASL